jgi:Methyltransferase domain
MSLKRRMVAALAPAIDHIMAPLVWLAAHQLLLVRKLTPGKAPQCMRVLDRVGIYPLIDHYYDPMINHRHLHRPLDAMRDLPGLDLNTDSAMTLLEHLCGLLELPAPVEPTPVQPAAAAGDFDLDNTMFGPLDAAIYGGMIRAFRPRRIVEVGAGMSTAAAIRARLRNQRDDPGYDCDHLCIEPFEQPWLDHQPIRLLRTPMEHCDRAIPETLEQNDILFIDSSHMIRPQGDVLTAVLDWLGRLKPNVLVHFHDVYTPRDYPKELLVLHRFFWNEQYLVEAFLAFNSQFEVLLPANHLYNTFPDRVRALCPQQTDERVVPASFWLRRRA